MGARHPSCSDSRRWYPGYPPVGAHLSPLVCPISLSVPCGHVLGQRILGGVPAACSSALPPPLAGTVAACPPGVPPASQTPPAAPSIAQQCAPAPPAPRLSPCMTTVRSLGEA
eukprot:9493465-Pyramimonas_sp.AAC.1